METETFSKAMELLGNDVFAIRLGGILQLETLAQQSRRLHWPIMEAFCAYLREQRPMEGRTAPDETGARPADTSGDRSDSTDAGAAFPADLQAIVTAIGRRNRRHDPAGTRLPLERVNLSGASLQGAHLEGANLRGAHLKGANLFRARLERAQLVNAHLERAQLIKAHLEGAKLDAANLEGASLNGAHLEGAILSGAHLEGANLRAAHLERAQLINAHLERAQLIKARLERAHLMEAHLEGADLRITDITQGQIDEAFGNAETRLPDSLTYPFAWTPLAQAASSRW